MGMPRYAARRDKNDPELAQLALRLGAKLVRAGPFDYWVGFRGRWVLTEIKDPKKEGHADEYTTLQRELIADCHVRQLPFWVWRTKDDLYRDLGAKVTA